jgi:hypothetical protein
MKEQFTHHNQSLVSIPDFDGYYAGEDGLIYSCQSNWRGYGIRSLSTQCSHDGYNLVYLTVGIGKTKKKKVHFLVCSAFHGKKKLAELEVRHLDGNRLNNKPNNLKWGTRSENAMDRSKHGKKKGRYGNNQKLTISQVTKIRSDNRSNSDIANDYNVNSKSISNIKRGKTWKQK